MGMFAWFASAEEQRAEEVRSGTRAPDRTERQKCWDARDDFYRCLDKNNVIDSLNGDGKEIAGKQCAGENQIFERDCASAWVDYFKRWRIADYKKKKMQEQLEKEGAVAVSP